MKKILLFFIFLIILIPTIVAIGITPPTYTVDFQPNFEHTYSMYIINSHEEPMRVKIDISGPLSPYITLLDDVVEIGPYERAPFSYNVHLPEELPPGKNRGMINFLDDDVKGGGMFNVKVGVIAQFVVKVPYPGLYAEMKLGIKDINEKEDLPYTVTITNLGTEDISGASLELNIEDIEGKKGKKMVYKDISIASKDKHVITDSLPAGTFPKGVYSANAIFNYGKTVSANKTFRIGSYEVIIVNNTDTVYRSQITPFDIYVKSNWNEGLKGLYAIVKINDKEYKSVSYDIDPFGEAKLTAYVNDKTLDVNKTYNGKITIYYQGETTEKSFKLKVLEKPIVSESPTEAKKAINIPEFLKSPTTYLLIAVLILIGINVFFLLQKGKKHKTKKK